MVFPAIQSPTRTPQPAATPDELDKLLDDVPDAPKTPTPTRTAPVTPQVGNSRTKALEDFARSNGFEPSDGFATSGHNRGSKHYSGYALDVHVKDRKPEDVDGFIQKAKEAGYIVRDERVRPAGQAVWSGPHLHLEYDDLDQLLSDLPDEQSQQNIDTPIAPNRQRDITQQPTTTPQINLRRSVGSQAGQVVGEAVNQPQSQEQTAAPSQAKFTPNVNYAQTPFDPNRLAPMSPSEAATEYMRHFGAQAGLKDKYLEAFVAQAIKEGGADFTYTQGERKGQQISREDFESIKKTGFSGVDVRDSVRKLAQDYLKSQSSPAMELNDLGVYERNRQKVSDYIDEHTPQVAGDLLVNAQNAVNTQEGVKLRNPPTELSAEDRAQLAEAIKADSQRPAMERVLSQPTEGFTGALVSEVGNVLKFLKVAPDAADTLRSKGLQLEIQSQTDHARNDPAGWVETAGKSLMGAGLSVAELILLKEATGASLPSIMVGQSVAHNLDKDEGTQLSAAAKAYIFGNVLDKMGGLTRLQSAGAFGVGQPTMAFAEGERSPRKLFGEAVGGIGLGAAFGGAEKPEEARFTRTPEQPAESDSDLQQRLNVINSIKAKVQNGEPLTSEEQAIADEVVARHPLQGPQAVPVQPPETSTQTTTAQARPIPEAVGEKVIAERQEGSGAGKSESKSAAGGSVVSSPEPAPVQMPKELGPLAEAVNKYDTAKEFAEAHTQSELVDLSNRDMHRFGRAISPYAEDANYITAKSIQNDPLLEDLRLSNPDVHSVIANSSPTMTIYRAVPADRVELIAKYEAQKREILRRGKIQPSNQHFSNSSEQYEWLGKEIERLEAQTEGDAKRVIEVGDWVAPARRYAVEHGESNLHGEYTIIRKTVPKQDVLWDGADFEEWVYSPQRIRDYARSLPEFYEKVKSQSAQPAAHHELQPRRQRNVSTGTKGQFKSETRGQREARQAQISEGPLIDRQRYQDTMARNGPEYGIESEADIPSPEEAYQTFKDEYAAVKESINEYETQLQSGKRLRESARRSLEAKADSARERLGYLEEHAANLFGERAAKEITGNVARETKQEPTTPNSQAQPKGLLSVDEQNSLAKEYGEVRARTVNDKGNPKRGASKTDLARLEEINAIRERHERAIVQMTPDEYAGRFKGGTYKDSMGREFKHEGAGKGYGSTVDYRYHQHLVREALKRGENVPDRVLAFYPELAKQYGRQTQTAVPTRQVPQTSQPRTVSEISGQGEKGASPQLIEAYKAWTENRAYIDGAGNYHVRPESATPTRSQRGPIAPWNKLVKETYKDSAEFHRAAQEYVATPKEGEEVSDIQGNRDAALSDVERVRTESKPSDSISTTTGRTEAATSNSTQTRGPNVPDEVNQEAISPRARKGDTQRAREQVKVDDARPVSVPEGKTDASAIAPRVTGAKGETGIKNEVKAQERSERNLPPVEVEGRRSFGQAWESTKARIERGEVDPSSLAKEIVAKPRPLSIEESAALVQDAVRIRNADRATQAEIEEAQKSGDVDREAGARARLKLIEEARDLNDRAARASGYEQGLGLAARRMMAQEDYSLSTLKQRAKVANGGEIPDEVRTRLETLSKQIEEMEVKLNQKDEAYAKLKAERSIERMKREEALGGRRQRRQVSRADLDKEFSDLSATFGQKASKLHAGIDPELAVLIGKMAKNRVKAGINSVEGLVDEIHAKLKDYVDDKRDIRDAISGYGQESEMSKDGVSVRLRELKRQMRLASAIEDAESGEKPLRSGLRRDKDTRRVAEMRRELQAALRKGGLDREPLPPMQNRPRVSEIGPKQGPKEWLTGAKKRLRKQITALESQMQTKEFAKVKARTPLVYDREGEALKIKRDRLRAEADAEIRRLERAQRHPVEKVADMAVRFFRNIRLSGVTTIFKLTNAVASRVALTPIEEGVGSGLRRLPYISRVAEKAPREGYGFNPRAERSALSRTFSAETLREAGRALKTGKSGLDIRFGDKSFLNDPEVLAVVGHAHSALKTPAKINEFYRASIQRAEHAARLAIKGGMSAEEAQRYIERPDVALGILKNSYDDSLRAVLLNDTGITSAYNTLLGAAMRRGPLGKAVGYGLRFVFPVTRTPVNLTAEVTSYAAGGMKAFGKLVARRGVENLTPEEADYVMRNLKKQVVGTPAALATLTAVAYFGAKYIQLGGYYQQGDNKKNLEVKAGEAKVFGVPVPKWAMHTPLLDYLQMVATVKRVHDDQVKANGDSPWMNGLWRGLVGVASEVPFYDFITRAPTQLEDWKGARKFAGEEVRSAIIPPDAQRIARGGVPFTGGVLGDLGPTGQPVQRKPSGFFEAIEEGIPFARRNLSIGPVFGTTPTKGSDEVQRLGITVKGIERRDDESQADYIRRRDAMNPSIGRAIDETVSSPDYDKLSDEEKRKAIQQVIRDAAEGRPSRPYFDRPARPRREVRPVH